jgi:DNA-directed RNA polymerase specialized sigma24 family protein
MEDVGVARTDPDVLAGDWFDALYRDHWSGMVRLAFVMVGDRSAAEELAQEAFAGVFRRAASVRDPLPYLRSAVYNVTRNYLRSQGRRGVVAGEPFSEVPFGDHVIDAIRRLPERQQVLVVLRYYEGLTDREIAAATGKPIGSVKSTLHRALETLRKELR